MSMLRTDAGRDRVEVQVRLDKVVLLVEEDGGVHSQTELTPAEARELARLLEGAAGSAEQTPGS